MYSNSTHSDSSGNSVQPLNTISRKIVRERLNRYIDEGFRQDVFTLIEALPASGKSYGVLLWAAQTGYPLTVFVPRYDLMDEYEEWCDELDLVVTRLPAFHRDCESLSLDDDDEPEDELTKNLLSLYRQGIGGGEIHDRANELLREDLPCQNEGRCPFMENRSIEADDFDVLLGHYLHAYQTDWTDDRYVAIDEFPGDAFVQGFKGDVAPAVTAYVEQEERLPFLDYDDLLEHKSDFREEISEWKREVWSLYDSSHVIRSANAKAHSLGPLMTLANLEMKLLENRWRYANLGDGRVAARNPDHEWWFLLPPNLESAESVVGLDGTPIVEMWELVMSKDMKRISLLEEAEKQEYLKNVLSLELVQTTENWNAYQGGDGVAPTVDIPVIETVGQLEGKKPGVITSKEGFKQYEPHGLDSFVTKTEHYGNLKGSNDFETVRLGIVLGNPHPGDDVIEKWCALAGRSAERREGTVGKDTNYGYFGNRVLEGLVHNEVLQAAMRFGRKDEAGEKGATVYIHTSALPEWVEPEKRLVSVDPWQSKEDGMRQVIEAIYDLDDWQNQEWKTGDVAERVDISKRYTREHLKTLVEHGYLDSWQGGRGKAYHFSNSHLEDAPKYGHVDFSG